jgi:hypothetical protein
VVTQGTGGQLEVLGLGLGVGPVAGKEAGRMPPLGDAAQGPNGVAADLDGRLMEGAMPITRDGTPEGSLGSSLPLTTRVAS